MLTSECWLLGSRFVTIRCASTTASATSASGFYGGILGVAATSGTTAPIATSAFSAVLPTSQNWFSAVIPDILRTGLTRTNDNVGAPGTAPARGRNCAYILGSSLHSQVLASTIASRPIAEPGTSPATAVQLYRQLRVYPSNLPVPVIRQLWPATAQPTPPYNELCQACNSGNRQPMPTPPQTRTYLGLASLRARPELRRL